VAEELAHLLAIVGHRGNSDDLGFHDLICELINSIAIVRCPALHKICLDHRLYQPSLTIPQLTLTRTENRLPSPRRLSACVSRTWSKEIHHEQVSEADSQF
jgi:hypothetical protein